MYSGQKQIIKKLESRVKKLEKQNKRLTTALEFYASPSVYDVELAPRSLSLTMDKRFISLDYDAGDIAREALDLEEPTYLDVFYGARGVLCPKCLHENYFVLHADRIYCVVEEVCRCWEDDPALLDAMFDEARLAFHAPTW
jgi:hypothetical protein